jgi:hypothetical protein
MPRVFLASVALAQKLLIEGPLARPLRFGDAEQIAALKEWRGVLEDEATEEGAEANGEDVEWEVTYTVEKTRTVMATSRDEAEEIVYDLELETIDDILSVELSDAQHRNRWVYPHAG